MDDARIELSLSSREIVMVSLLAELGIATLTQDIRHGASVLETIAKLEGSEEVAGRAMKRLQDAMELAVFQIEATEGMVS